VAHRNHQTTDVICIVTNSSELPMHFLATQKGLLTSTVSEFSAARI